MQELSHILDRFVIHLFSSMSLVLLTFFALRMATRKLRSQWLPTAWRHSLMLAALTVFTISTMRESWDVSHGQSLVKAFTDYTSWLLGCVLSVWGLYRFGKESD